MTIARTAETWRDGNVRGMQVLLERPRTALEQVARAAHEPVRLPETTDDELPPALATLSRAFGLTAFERDMLVLCAAVELDPGIGELCAAARRDPASPWPTFTLATAVFPHAHWSASAPVGPLRRWRLVQLCERPRPSSFASSPLRIDERVLHFLMGLLYIDEGLTSMLEPVAPTASLSPSQSAIADRLVSIWQGPADRFNTPVLQLCGADTACKREIAAAASSRYGMSLLVMRAETFPSGTAEFLECVRLSEREAVFNNSVLYVEGDASETTERPADTVVHKLLDVLATGIVVVSTTRQLALKGPSVSVDVRPPAVSEQRMLWTTLLGSNQDSDKYADQLVAEFDLDVSSIREAHMSASNRLATAGSHSPPALDALIGGIWDECRLAVRPQLEPLAERIESHACWDDLVLPELQLGLLHEIALQMGSRSIVYHRWGFASRTARGLGITALFAGPSGTGKTLAAEVLGQELGLDVYRIDLAATVSKYIGETEKNLGRIFDAAARGGAILLFDEADALFGKRTEVRDSHDRYANIEVSYLLQRMESFRGLAILTTNMKDALDRAFLRRLRFVVDFPFPDAANREKIWRGVFPQSTPVAGLDLARLARLDVSGGSIRNIALRAAFQAAGSAGPVQMEHVVRAANYEYRKLDKAFPASFAVDHADRDS